MEFSPARNNRSQRHRRPVVFSVIGFFLLLAISILLWATADNKGVVVEQSDAPNRHGAAIKEYSGKYITFRYVGVYSEKKSGLGDRDLEATMLTADTNYEKHLAVSVSEPENGLLDNFSPYTARKTRTDLYKRQDVTTAVGPAVQFTKNDFTERTVFVVQNNRVATLSFVSQGAAEDLQPEIDQLLTTIRWKP